MRNFSKKITVVTVLFVAVFFCFIPTNPTAAYSSFSGEEVFTSLVSGMLKVEIIKPDGLGSLNNEKYLPSKREYVGIPAIEKTGKRLWALFQTGGDGEPQNENYCVLAYSDDDGENWTDPFLIIEEYAGGEECCVKTPLLHSDGKNKLYVFFGYETKLICVLIENASGNIGAVVINAPKIILQGNTFATRLTCVEDVDGGETWYFCGDLAKAERTTVWKNSSPDKLNIKNWSVVGSAQTVKTESEGNLFHEAMLIPLEGNTLWMLKRLEARSNIGIEQSVSYNGGTTWTQYDSPSQVQLHGAGSKFHFRKLKSGNILFITNDSTVSRINLTAYLSTDGGETFPYSLLLDGRTDVSYPDATEDEEGNIYCIYDKGRSDEAEIRMAKFTEDDIINGCFSDGSLKMSIVYKGPAYSEIASVDLSESDIFNGLSNVRVEDGKLFALRGISADDLLGKLPDSFNVTLNNGEKIKLYGNWSAPMFVKNKTGEYKLKFNCENLDETVQDTYGMLNIGVTVVEDFKDLDSSRNGCGGSVAVLVGTILAACVVLGRR